MKPSLVLYFIISAFLMSSINCLQNGNACIPHAQLSLQAESNLNLSLEDQDIIEDKEKLFEDPDFAENIDEIIAEVEQSPLDESNEAEYEYDEADDNAFITGIYMIYNHV